MRQFTLFRPCLYYKLWLMQGAATRSCCSSYSADAYLTVYIGAACTHQECLKCQHKVQCTMGRYPSVSCATLQGSALWGIFSMHFGACMSCAGVTRSKGSSSHHAAFSILLMQSLFHDLCFFKFHKPAQHLLLSAISDKSMEPGQLCAVVANRE